MYLYAYNMKKEQEFLLPMTCSTRLCCKLNFKKSKFTASDLEIISDLKELKYLALVRGNKNAAIDEICNSLPQKRKKKLISSQDPEDEAIFALATLMQCRNPRQQRKQSLEICQKTQENLKNHEDACVSKPLYTSNILTANSCRKTVIAKVRPFAGHSFRSTKTLNHVDIAWITHKLKVSS